LQELADSSIDACVCDPPYHLTNITRPDMGEKATPYNRRNTHIPKTGFMGQTWDGGDVAFQPETWAEVLRVLKPGGHLVAFSGTRTYHRMAVAIEDAGFEVRDRILDLIASDTHVRNFLSGLSPEQRGAFFKCIEESRFGGELAWTFGSGFPKSLNLGDGQGTALKPAHEPICLARKPLIGSVASNVLAHGTGALNIDGCRIEGVKPQVTQGINSNPSSFNVTSERRTSGDPHEGRWPANLCHDGSDEVLAGFPDADGAVSNGKRVGNGYGEGFGAMEQAPSYADSGSAARFFYCAKTTTEERGEGNNHPTVKPQALMRWLVRLVTPPGGTVLDPFMGSGSTGLAADAEQFDFIGCEMSSEYAAIAEKRIRDAAGMFAEVKAA
jgi:site-specific DNA-methyltransferase (adenine-specific)